MHTSATPRHQGKRAVPLLCWLVIETRFGVNFGCIFREFCAWDRVASRWCDQTYQKIMSVVKYYYRTIGTVKSGILGILGIPSCGQPTSELEKSV